MENAVKNNSVGLRKLVYAVGDIHGCADLLTRLMEKIEKDAEKFPDFLRNWFF